MLRIIEQGLKLLLPYACLICGRRTHESHICVRCTPSPLPFAFRCARCHAPMLGGDSEICESCLAMPGILYQTRYLWNYSEPRVHAFINVMKYRPSERLCKIAGVMLAEAWSGLFGVHDYYDLLLPVPTSKASLYSRGFNQCQLIAQEISSRRRNLELNLRGLGRRAETLPQASLAHARRISNVREAFRANPAIVRNRAVLLLDDVVTTGATSSSAAIALLDAGAAIVGLMCLARADISFLMRIKVARIKQSPRVE